MRLESLFIAASLAACAAFYVYRASRRGLACTAACDAAILGVIGAFLGSRLLPAILTDVSVADALYGSPGSVSWGAYAGGLAGGIAALTIHRNSSLLSHLDAGAPALLAGIAIARVGCYVAGDDFGRVCDYLWCTSFPRGSQAYKAHLELGWVGPNAARSLRVHPLQLYLAAAALFGSLCCLLLERRRLGNVKGAIAVCAAVSYCVPRAALESLRDPQVEALFSRDAFTIIPILAAALTSGSAIAWYVHYRITRGNPARGSSG